MVVPETCGSRALVLDLLPAMGYEVRSSVEGSEASKVNHEKEANRINAGVAF